MLHKTQPLVSAQRVNSEQLKPLIYALQNNQHESLTAAAVFLV